MAQSHSNLKLDTPVQYVKGVGPKLAQTFAKREIYTLKDLLEYYPRAYEDRRAARNIASLQEGETVSLKARLGAIQSFRLGKSNKRAYDVILEDDSGRIRAKFFRIPFQGYFDRFQNGQWVRVVGKVGTYRGVLEFHHPDLRDIESDEENQDELVPIYPEIDTLTSAKIRRVILNVLEAMTSPSDVLQDHLPQKVISRLNLVSREQAVRMVHQPPRDASREFLDLKSPAHRRLIFDEFFELELYLAQKRQGLTLETAPALQDKTNLIDRLIASLPFQLTSGQKQAFEEIKSDLLKPHPMHRLVQGDVGSGKTLVAFLAASLAAENGLQTALMVPTEILAEQHFKNATRWLEPLGLRVGLLTGSSRSKEREQLLGGVMAGHVHLLIGTHALIQDDVDFHNLGLVIVDEQHRFGVHQRERLKAKGLSPHFLVMTATPIPRTLAMTVYGDLEVSTIRERPAGRQPIQTRVVYQSKKNQVLDFLKAQLVKGRQAYVVYPLVEESEKMDLKNAVSEFESLKQILPEYQLGLLHGRMKQEEKDHIMDEFRANKIQVLVSTTVIEVGVDVPNANLIVVEHAERFGLSQLHQLRGRVGRGEHKSFCVLVLGHAVSPESYERVQFMEKTDDGFQVAEFDLEIRGPGELLGSRQSGLPGFKLANLVRDAEILTQARQAAFEIVSQDHNLSRSDHQSLNRLLQLSAERRRLLGA
jgi:ATP-dependent DNA helicase RecG